MPAFEIRTFRRSDRDQVARLVTSHAAAVLPGASVSVSSVLAQFEREPAEVIVDPWVAERCALVAEQAGAVVAAALVVRYRREPDVGTAYRGAGEIRWLVFHPEAPAGNPHWHDGRDAAEALLLACLHRLERWQVTRTYADGALPVPAVCGIPEQWPHVADLYARNGFAAVGAEEVVLIVDLADLGPVDLVPVDLGPVGLAQAPMPDLAVRRTVGINGTRFTAVLGHRPAGYLEVDVLDHGERHPRSGGLADIGNLHIDEDLQRRGLGSYLLRHATAWLRLGRVDRLLAYAGGDEGPLLAFLARHHFVEITRTRRGWERPTSSTQS